MRRGARATLIVTGWSIDSRTIAPGDLFFALRGPNHDGNAYVDEALRKGAAAAVATKGGSIRARSGLLVPDALVKLADHWPSGRAINGAGK
jgi:UDP-N-acetylmuramoyl-tripeptide--D-alanyl-D-alanine ligase